MATACPKSFSTKWDEEMYFDLEYQLFCKNFKFSVSLFSFLKVFKSCVIIVEYHSEIKNTTGIYSDAALFLKFTN